MTISVEGISVYFNDGAPFYACVEAAHGLASSYGCKCEFVHDGFLYTVFPTSLGAQWESLFVERRRNLEEVTPKPSPTPDPSR